MVLIRGYSKVDEEAKIAIPSHIRFHTGLEPNSLAEIEVVRIKDSNRRPYLIVRKPGSRRPASRFEVVFTNVIRPVDEEGKLSLDADLRSLADLDTGHLVELKLCGSRKDPWLSIRYQGPKQLTTLQERIGIKKTKNVGTCLAGRQAGFIPVRKNKKWQKMTFDY